MTATLLERSVRRTLTRLPADRPGTADGDLLARFRDAGDGAAFADLVARHGPTVLGVCRRVLGDRHAAEDAFQATFLVLARRADAVRPPDRVGAFLYGVAYRTALKARGRAFRRQQVEREWGNRAAAARPGVGDPDVLAAVDQALNALPEKYRLPLLLCGVEGLGKKEAADRLGWAEGTVSSRLARGRDLLRDRLTRRGLAVPAAAISALLTPDALRAAVPPALSTAAADTGSAGPAVLALSTEVVRSMALIKWKLVAAVALAVGLAGGGVGLFAAKAEEKKPAAAPADKPKAEGEKPKLGGEKPKPDGEKGEKKVLRASGRVAAVDAAAGTVTLGKEGDKKNEQVIQIGADTKVSVDGKPGELKDIPVGAVVEVGFATDGGPATDVRAAGRRLSGIVAKVEGSTVTLEPAGDAKAGESFTVGPKTQVMAEGKEGKGTADDLKPGMRVGVQVSVDGKTAVTLKAGRAGGEGEKKPEKKPAPDKPRTEKPSPEKPKPVK